MAVFSANISIWNKHNDVVQKAAYNSRSTFKYSDGGHTKAKWEKIENEYQGGGVALPVGVPNQFRNREYLWNTINDLEKNPNAQVARSFIMSFPIELNHEQRIKMAQEFALNMSKEGMIFQWDYHDKPGNPHLHGFATMREFNIKTGKFKPKSRTVYPCICKATGEIKKFHKVGDIKKWNEQNPNNKFERQPLLDKNGNQKYTLKNKKYKNYLWVSEKEKTNNWDSRQNVEKWRAQWAELGNVALEKAGLDVRWTHKSYKRQAEELGLSPEQTPKPQRHLGVAAANIEKKEKVRCAAAGIEYQPKTKIAKINFTISERNKYLQKLIATTQKIQEKKNEFLNKFENKWDRFRYKMNVLPVKIQQSCYSFTHQLVTQNRRLALAGMCNQLEQELKHEDIVSFSPHIKADKNLITGSIKPKVNHTPAPPLNHDSLSSNRKAADRNIGGSGVGAR